MSRPIAGASPALALAAVLASPFFPSLFLPSPLGAQPASVTLPPDGDNQRATVVQHVGLVRVSVDYSSPDVHAPDGGDRAGRIWGALVPYGMADLGFGTCGDQCPWRGGANQNTVFATSHDLLVQGKELAAGAYGLHFVPGPEEWTVIFSRNSTSWGSFFYDAGEDALRVQAKPEKGEYHEWLTYEFTDRRPDRATLALMWENLRLPLQLTVEDPEGLWVENLRRELRSNPGFSWQGWQQAAAYVAGTGKHLEQGLEWAQQAVDGPLGQRNFTTLSTLARLQEATGRAGEAQATMTAALEHPTAGPLDLHFFARRLQGEGKNEEAMRVFELNARRHPGAWPTAFGLARGHAGLGRKAEAIAQARAALAEAPDDAAKGNVQRFIEQLEAAP